MRYLILLSYDGTALSGWQIQPGVRTVQGCLETALRTLLGEEIGVTGAGRTDAGVNAVGYVAHFETSGPLSMETGALLYKLNAITPPEIVIHEVRPVPFEDFHARFSACCREYTYFIHRTRNPFIADYSYFLRIPLDVEKMNRAAQLLIGTHDFSCFEKTGSDNVSSLCTVTEAYWASYTPTQVSLLHYPAAEGDYLYFRIRANRFLRNMVRAVVGSLLEVGRGKQEPEWIASLLDGGGTRCDAGESVPGHALFLSGVEYPDEP